MRVQQQEGESISEYVKRAEVYSVLVQQGGHMSVVEGVMLQEGLRDKVMKQQLEDECVEDWQVTVDRLISVKEVSAFDRSECTSTTGCVSGSSSSSSEGGSGRKKSYRDVVVQSAVVQQTVMDMCAAAQEGKKRGCESRCECECKWKCECGCKTKQQHYRSRIKCWCCGRIGHIAALCWYRQQVDESRSVGYNRNENISSARNSSKYSSGRWGSRQQGGVWEEKKREGKWQGGSGGDRRVEVDAVEARRLIAMGFVPVRVVNALVSACNNIKRAVDRLLGECVEDRWQKVGQDTSVVREVNFFCV